MISENRQKVWESALGADSKAVINQLDKSNATNESATSALGQESDLSENVINRAKPDRISTDRISADEYG
jgi:hypothetical protein